MDKPTPTDLGAAVAALAERCNTCRLISAQDVAAALPRRALNQEEAHALRRLLAHHGLSVVDGDIEETLASRFTEDVES